MAVSLVRRAVLALPLVVCTALLAGQAPVSPKPAREYGIQAVPFYDVTVDDRFWAPRLERNRAVSIPHIMSENVRTNRVANFEKAALNKGEYEGKRFNDSDVYKTIEAAAYTLRVHPDPDLFNRLYTIIDHITRAQSSDGYLYPARTLGATPPVAGIGPQRWVNLNGSHELYNVGHLYEAAIAWQTCASSDRLMNVATKNFELLNREFGPNARKAVPGHEEIELALIKLYRLTGDERYFSLARFFLDQRGRPHDTRPYPPEDTTFAIYNDRPYMQDHEPVTQQTRAVGHAVRAMYLYCAMTDVAALADDVAYGKAVDRIWADVVSKRMYVTGGLGSRGKIEGFGDDYELPNEQAYAETCASVGNDLWNQRMFLLHGEAKYVDVLERVLYNGFLSGVSADGKQFSYRNPLESDGKEKKDDDEQDERRGYPDVACCPSNLARLMAQLPGLIYAQRDDQIFVNLFVGGRAHVTLPFGRVDVAQMTDYPWDGKVSITVTPAGKAQEFELLVRVPGWAREEPVPSPLYRYADRRTDRLALLVDGQAFPLKVENGYARIRRRWSPGDVVQLDFPMPVRRVVAHEGVKADRGRAAIERGPIVYAVEGVDNNGHARNIAVPLSVVLKYEFRPTLLGGLGVVAGPGVLMDGRGSRPVQVTAIPYFAWANRGRGEMSVWLPYENRPGTRP